MKSRDKTIRLLKKWYPHQYRCDNDSPWGIIHFNFDMYYTIGNGWNDIILEMHKELNESGYVDYTVRQIKEKFGVLRVYLKCNYDKFKEISTIVHKYEFKSSYTCEHCGEVESNKNSKNFLRNIHGYMVTLCDKCHKMEVELYDRRLMKHSINSIDKLKSHVVNLVSNTDERIVPTIEKWFEVYKFSKGE
jgi:hypothetical protein